MFTYQSAFYSLLETLKPLYDEREAAAIAHEVMEYITGKTKLQRITDKDTVLTTLEATRFSELKEKLATGQPMQYAIGEAWFMGRPFIVNRSVLIPRPETEELVQWVIDDQKNNISPKTLLDIGTGSGCIPISLKLALPAWQVTSCDISKAALSIAALNAEKHKAEISLMELDFLNNDAGKQLPSFDIIISNPPYIPQNEKRSLDAQVRNHEPSLALFVPDDDALLFYRVIAGFGLGHLNKEGAIYCETHTDYAIDIQKMFEQFNYITELRKDIHGNNRMIKATLKN